MATKFIIIGLSLVLLLLNTKTVPNPVINKMVNPYIEEYSSNTRVIQWKHYFDSVKMQTSKTKSNRNKYIDLIATEFRKTSVSQNRAEIYMEIPGIESAWNPNTADSPKGAKGLWQIMPYTANRFGYSTKAIKNPVYATKCAVAFLSFLDSVYVGDVAAVLFAYNAGEYRVNTEMSRFKTNNTWLIEFTKRETYNFAPKVLGAWLHHKN